MRPRVTPWPEGHLLALKLRAAKLAEKLTKTRRMVGCSAAYQKSGRQLSSCVHEELGAHARTQPWTWLPLVDVSAQDTHQRDT